MSQIEKEISKYVQILFPDGNYYMYWLYASFILIFPILLYAFVLVLIILDNGVVLSTDTFVASMPFATSHRCSGPILDLISVLLMYISYLWVALFIHTLASVLFDMYYINERRNDL